MLSLSMKKQHQFEEMAALLGEKPLKLRPLHGICWMASHKGAIKALLRNWVPFVLFLEELALSVVGCDLTTTSPGASFIGKKSPSSLKTRFLAKKAE